MAKSFKDFPPAAQAGLIGLVPLIVVGVLSYLYVYPLADQRADLDSQVKKLTAENKINQAFEQKQTEYKNRISQLQTELETLRSIVPDEQATDEFMQMVFRTGTEAGVHVRTFLPQPLVPKDYYVEEPFKVRLDGTYWGLVNYFDRLAHEQRIVSVTDIKLGTPSGGGLGSYEVAPSESVGADCVLVTYFNKLGTQGAAAAPKR
ncbi:MAG: type 4a pilus biogenesis protein PilO [Terriglobia bacterium]|jgi:type IV pilus assembly protein PilO